MFSELSALGFIALCLFIVIESKGLDDHTKHLVEQVHMILFAILYVGNQYCTCTIHTQTQLTHTQHATHKHTQHTTHTHNTYAQHIRTTHTHNATHNFIVAGPLPRLGVLCALLFKNNIQYIANIAYNCAQCGWCLTPPITCGMVECSGCCTSSCALS